MSTEKSVGSCCSETCCGDSMPGSAATTTHVQDNAVREQVRTGYAAIAKAGSWAATKDVPNAVAAPVGSCCGGGATGGGCCGPADLSPEQLIAAIGYSDADIQHTPDSANMGLSCGNPTAIASLKPGEVVLDLGSGGGFDCFVAGPKVGAKGRVIGVDMTPEMLSKARQNTALYSTQSGLDNVEFRLGEIEHLPVADSSVDVVISNCVLNLSPNKAQVWREIARVLKPGGRVAVSDLALLRPLPESVRVDIEALVGCVAGAVLVEETRLDAQAAGLMEIQLLSKPQYVEAMTNWQDPLYKKIAQHLPSGANASDFITSLDVTARKG